MGRARLHIGAIMLTDMGRERGVSALLTASALLLMMGMAAIALDVSAGYNERRQDQTAADAGALAGALEYVLGGSAASNKVTEYVAVNLDTTAGAMQTAWESCVDPAAERNTQPGDNFVALPPPSGWTVTDPDDWCISVDSAKALLRVRVPLQSTSTTFGRVLGMNEINTFAVAVARIESRGSGGILPFGLGSGANGGYHTCLSDAPSGLATNPCDGGTTGNFGTLKIRQFGNTTLGTSTNCTASPLDQTLAQNIAVGTDHEVVTDPDGLTSNEVRDECFNPGVDTLNTDTSFSEFGAEDGMVGPVPGMPAATPRLKQTGPFTGPIFNDHRINDKPLWEYLLNTVTYDGTVAPTTCDPASFTGGVADYNGNGLPDDDFDGDGIQDQARSWQHMAKCLDDYASGLYATVIFDETILDNSSRFGYLPQFWEDDLGTGSQWNHIQRFRAIYINATVWKKGPTYKFHVPGEPCMGCGGNGWALKQVTAYVFPDASLPPVLRGDPIPGLTGLNPFEIELAR